MKPKYLTRAALVAVAAFALAFALVTILDRIIGTDFPTEQRP